MPRGLPTFLFLLVTVAALGVLTWSLGATSGPATAPVSPLAGRTGTLRVMTANVRMATPEDKENAWPLRRELFVKQLLRANADIVGTQELSPAQGAYLNKEFTGIYAWYPRAGVSAAPATGASSEVLGVLGSTVAGMTTTYYRIDRFDAVDGESGLVLPDQIQANPTENAYFSLVVLKEKATGKPLIVVDTHLRHGIPFATQCAQELTAKGERWKNKFPDAAVIVMGDFNHDRTSPVYAALVGYRALPLADSFDYSTRKPGELWGTYHAFKGKPLRDFPTDLIFTTGLTLKTPATILRDTAPDGRYPTDHFLILSEFQP